MRVRILGRTAYLTGNKVSLDYAKYLENSGYTVIIRILN